MESENSDFELPVKKTVVKGKTTKTPAEPKAKVSFTLIDSYGIGQSVKLNRLNHVSSRS